jgi:guanine deaminase
MSSPHEDYMHAAIELALAGVQEGCGGPFGAVVVKDGQIIGRGRNLVTSTNDPTAHAEVVAIREACRALHVFHLVGCEIYASCEPCPMCLAAIYWARVDRLYFGATAAEAAASGFSDETICEQMALPRERRSLAAVQIRPGDILVPFEAWQAKRDRIPY